VRAGDVIAHVDLAEIKKEGYDTVIPVLMSNIDGSAKLSPRLGYAEGGRTAVLKLNGGKEVK
jgi:phosphotransferase system IIA component